MKKLDTQKRLASRILKCSKKKIKIDNEQIEDVKEAITNIDIKSLIKKKAITRVKPKNTSRYHARIIKQQKRKGRKKGVGSRQGKKTARLPRKEVWMNLIRAQRDILKRLKENGKIDHKTYRDLYSKSTGGFFRSKRHLKLYMEDHGLFKK